MAILGMESFGQYTPGTHAYTDTEFAGIWTMTAGDWKLTSLGDGRAKLGTAYYTTTSMKYLLKSAATTIVVGFYCHRNRATTHEIFILQHAGVGTVGCICMNSSGQIYWTTFSNDSNYVKLTSTQAVAVGVPTHITVKVVIDQTAGSVEIYFGGILDSSVTGVDTNFTSPTCNQLTVYPSGNYGGVPNTEISDLYADDSTVHGDVKCSYDPMDQSGSSADCTPTGDTNNEDCVDEVGPDEDTTYNRTTTNGDRDSLGHSGSGTVASAIAVMAIARARKEDANNASLKLGVKYGGSESLSAAKSLATSYAYITEIFDDVPGGSGWTAAQLAAAESLYENSSV
jgi:hypothetical protein